MKKYNKKKPDIKIKILTLGNSMVGKSSILNRYTDNKFHKNYLSTVGVDHQAKYIKKNDKLVEVAIWDTAGQEKFRAISKQYYKFSDGILLVYDVSSKESFDSIRSWMKEIKDETTEDTSVVLVCNKIDLPPNQQIITEQEGIDLANELKIKFFRVSALSGANIETAFNCLIDEILEIYSKNAEKDTNNNKAKCETMKLDVKEDKDFDCCGNRK